MKIQIEAEPKELAELVSTLQNKPTEKGTATVMCNGKSFEEAYTEAFARITLGGSRVDETVSEQNNTSTDSDIHIYDKGKLYDSPPIGGFHDW